MAVELWSSVVFSYAIVFAWAGMVVAEGGVVAMGVDGNKQFIVGNIVVVSNYSIWGSNGARMGMEIQLVEEEEN